MSTILFPQLAIHTAKPARQGCWLFRAPPEAVLLLCVGAIAVAVLLG
jgi:hypothetical protein